MNSPHFNLNNFESKLYSQPGFYRSYSRSRTRMRAEARRTNGGETTCDEGDGGAADANQRQTSATRQRSTSRNKNPSGNENNNPGKTRSSSRNNNKTNSLVQATTGKSNGMGAVSAPVIPHRGSGIMSPVANQRAKTILKHRDGQNSPSLHTQNSSLQHKTAQNQIITQKRQITQNSSQNTRQNQQTRQQTSQNITQASSNQNISTSQVQNSQISQNSKVSQISSSTTQHSTQQVTKSGTKPSSSRSSHVTRPYIAMSSAERTASSQSTSQSTSQSKTTQNTTHIQRPQSAQPQTRQSVNTVPQPTPHQPSTPQLMHSGRGFRTSTDNISAMSNSVKIKRRNTTILTPKSDRMEKAKSLNVEDLKSEFKMNDQTGAHLWWRVRNFKKNCKNVDIFTGAALACF